MICQHFENVNASDIGICCLCRLNSTANEESAKYDSVGQHEETARLHSQSGIYCKAFHAARHCKVSSDHLCM